MTDKPKFGHIEDNGPSDRERCAPHFTLRPFGPNATEICHAGRLVATVRHDTHLPEGFTERLAAFIMEMCTGKRTELWAEQAIYGVGPRDPAETRRRAYLQADEYARRREVKPDENNAITQIKDESGRVIGHQKNPNYKPPGGYGP